MRSTRRQPRGPELPPPPPPIPQLELFPVTPVVESLDPRSIIGARTGVEQLLRVRLRPAAPPHLVFHDRHGWYCEEHGPACEAVRVARTAVDAATAGDPTLFSVISDAE